MQLERRQANYIEFLGQLLGHMLEQDVASVHAQQCYVEHYACGILPYMHLIELPFTYDLFLAARFAFSYAAVLTCYHRLWV